LIKGKKHFFFLPSPPQIVGATHDKHECRFGGYHFRIKPRQHTDGGVSANIAITSMLIL
jgi:hypothetical protein